MDVSFEPLSGGSCGLPWPPAGRSTHGSAVEEPFEFGFDGPSPAFRVVNTWIPQDLIDLGFVVIR